MGNCYCRIARSIEALGGGTVREYVNTAAVVDRELFPSGEVRHGMRESVLAEQ
jgi:hypothetical protein